MCNLHPPFKNYFCKSGVMTFKSADIQSLEGDMISCNPERVFHHNEISAKSPSWEDRCQPSWSAIAQMKGPLLCEASRGKELQ